MSYHEEFPNQADDAACAAMAARADAWEDSSWRNDTCPSFMCDVFVLFIDHELDVQREFPGGPRFAMHCESEVMLETDDWADMLAFMDEGKRDFPEYVSRIEALIAEEEASAKPCPDYLTHLKSFRG